MVSLLSQDKANVGRCQINGAGVIVQLTSIPSQVILWNYPSLVPIVFTPFLFLLHQVETMKHDEVGEFCQPDKSDNEPCNKKRRRQSKCISKPDIFKIFGTLFLLFVCFLKEADTFPLVSVQLWTLLQLNQSNLKRGLIRRGLIYCYMEIDY